jgi:hypothetical protein
MNRILLHAIAWTAFTFTVWLAAHNQEQVFAQAPPAVPAGQAPARGGRGGGGGAPQTPPTARASATSDFTGYWVRIITEDWRWLMVVPNKGNSDSIQLSPAGQAILNAWDPAKDEADGNQCKGYGAGAISRLPTRAHVTWQDDTTLKWETDQGIQTRLFKFGAPAQTADTSARSWQGVSVATWEPAAGGGRGGAGGPGGPGGPAGFPGAPPAATDAAAALPLNVPPAPAAAGARGNNQNGWLKVVTNNLKSGYLRKNGVPYSEKATVTEYFQPMPETYGVRYMVVTTIIEDPDYFNGPLITSSNYKKLADTNNGWDPQPCSVR